MSEWTHGLAKASVMGLGLAALGYFGTSPPHTLKTVLGVAADVDAPTVLGNLSLLVPTLVVIKTVERVSIAMSIDNDGGTLALVLGLPERHAVSDHRM